jgi:uncharacterized protein YecE (DUF72 family)
MPQLYAGTSGFAYPNWKPAFYPPDLPARRFLEHYASRLNCVEINYTFRRLPSPSTLESWVRTTPPGFLFCPKGNMRITHILRLKDAGPAVETFLRAIDPLRSARRVGPILFQLPPQLKSDPELLAAFLPNLPEDLRFAMEFRHPSWLNPGIYTLLEKHGVALCLAESEKLEIPEVITAGFVYLRLRKPEYTPAERELVINKCRRFLRGGRDVFTFFKHEDRPDGALYAEEVLRHACRAAGAT